MEWWRVLTDYFIPYSLRDDLVAVQRSRLMLGLALLGVGLGGMYGVFYWSIGHYWGAAIILACILLIISVPVLIRYTGKVSIGGHLSLVVWAFGFAGLAWTEGGIHAHAVSWLACGGPLLALLILNWLPAMIWCGVCLSTIVIFGALELAHTPLPLGYPEHWHPELLAASMSGLVIFMSLLGILFEHARNQSSLSMQAAIAERMRSQDARQAAEDANRSKDQFLAMLSHELRTPLTPVLAVVTSLDGQEGLPADVRTDLEIIRRNVALEAQLIDDLLDVTRISRGKIMLNPMVLDAHSCLQSALAVCSEGIDAKQLQVSIELNAPEHHVRADPDRLRQAFWNLLRNAVRFTPTRGSVTLRTDNDVRSLVIQFTDSGIGIEPEVLSRIFDVFERGGETEGPRFGGLGLGLTIAKGIVEMHGGRLTAFSQGTNQGATFTIELPTVLPEPALRVPVEPAAETKVPGILLVEDNVDTLRILARLLQRAGFPVTTASSVQEALERSEEGGIELIISDLGLPDGSGLDLMRRIKQLYGIPGIALSGFGTDEDIQQSRAAGFQQHLVKPVAFTELRATIQRAMTT